jgi:hypothetical protein
MQSVLLRADEALLCGNQVWLDGRNGLFPEVTIWRFSVYPFLGRRSLSMMPLSPFQSNRPVSATDSNRF